MKGIAGILFISFTSFFSTVVGQGIITPDWIKTDSSINGTSEAWGIDTDSTGNIYWVTSNDKLNEGLDIYCYKFDSGGNALWAAPLIYGGLGTQHAYVCNASDTSLYIGGRSCSGLVTTCDMLLLKLNKNTGNLIWDRTQNFSANGYDEIDGLEIKPDGIYCGGWSQELNSSIYESDIGLWKLDFNGNTEWVNSLGVNNSAEHQDGHFVVDSSYIYAAGLWGGTGIANLFNGHSFIGTFSKSNGSLVDSTLFGHQADSFNDIENALGMTTDGTYLYVTGYTTPLNANDWQIFVAKFDKSLNQIWYTDWGGTGAESARAITVKNDKIYVAGLTESNSLMTGGDRDAVLLTLDKNGNVVNYQTYGGNDKESFQDLAADNNNNLYLTGMVEESSLNSKKSMLLAVKDITSSVKAEDGAISNLCIVYPNPSEGNVKIEFQKQEHEEGLITIFDLSGKQILTKPFDSNADDISFDLKTAGTFFLQITFPEYRITRKIVVRN